MDFYITFLVSKNTCTEILMVDIYRALCVCTVQLHCKYITVSTFVLFFTILKVASQYCFCRLKKKKKNRCVTDAVNSFAYILYLAYNIKYSGVFSKSNIESYFQAKKA